MERRFIQYNMWKNCKNHCEFCFNRGYKTSGTQDKLRILEFVTNKLKSTETDSYNEIGFIGGEFFENQLSDQKVKEGFYNLFNLCKERVEKGLLDKIYVATNLIYDMSEYLIPFISFLKKLNILDKTLFCTSFDLKYRFHKKEDLELWKSNMHEIKKYLDGKKVHTEIIVSQFFIDAVNSGAFDLLNFSKEFNTSVDFIEPTFIEYFSSREDFIKSLPDFFPKRSDFINFVKKYSDLGIIDLNAFLSIKLRSDTSYYDLNGKWVKLDNRWTTNVRRVTKNGEIMKVLSYSDSDALMLKDIEMLNENGRY